MKVVKLKFRVLVEREVLISDEDAFRNFYAIEASVKATLPHTEELEEESLKIYDASSGELIVEY